MGWSTRTTGTATSFLRITADRAHHVSEENEMSATRTETGWRDDKLTIARVAAGDLCNRETMVYDSVGIDVIIERLLRETRNVDKRISDMKRKSATQQRHSASLYEKYKGRADEISKLRSLLKSLALESDGYRKERDELRVLVDVCNSELAVADLLRQRDRAQAVVHEIWGLLRDSGISF